MAPSDKQISFLNSLLRDRNVPDSLRHEAEAVRDAGDRRDMSAMIDRLKACPWPREQAPQAERNAEVAVSDPGVYRRDGEVYIVKPNREKTKLYAKRLVEIGGERLAENGDVISIEFEYAPGAIYKLSPDDRMPFEDAKALTARYGRCIVCGRHLKAAQSVERGIGPVCRTYFPDAEPVRLAPSGRTDAEVAEAMAAKGAPVAIDAQTGEAHECLDGPAGCRGEVEFRMPLSSTGRSFARCEAHWERRLEEQERINERYPAMTPADFDPAYAGEEW